MADTTPIPLHRRLGRFCAWCARDLSRVGTGRRLADGSGWECRRRCANRPVILTEHAVYEFPSRHFPPRWEEPTDGR